MLCSVVLPTFNQSPLLRRTLASIFAQDPPFDWEVVVVNDGSTDDTADVLESFACERLRVINRPNGGIPAAVNTGLRAAQGLIVIMQSGDVVHSGKYVIERMCARLTTGTFVLASVRSAIAVDGQPDYMWQTKPLLPRGNGWPVHYNLSRRPYFFIGAAWRSDIYKIGGYDERFIHDACDTWFGLCLTTGLGLSPVYCDDIYGCHQWHPRPPSRRKEGRELCRKLTSEGVFHTETAPWPM